MRIVELIIFGLATWRIASLLVNEDGPFYIFYRLRERAGIGHDAQRHILTIPDRFLAQVLSCVWCCSIWIGFGWMGFWWFFPEVTLKLATAFSFSAVAIGIEKWMRG